MPSRGEGLTGEQVEQLRADVAGGRTPRVRVSGAQFGDAATGTVRAVGDPASDGEDFVTVRVRVEGVTDDLRFSPRELTRGGAPATRGARTAKGAPAGAPRATRTGRTAPRASGDATSAARTGRTRAAGPTATAPGATGPRPAGAAAAGSGAAGSGAPAAPAAEPRRSRTPRRGRAVPPSDTTPPRIPPAAPPAAPPPSTARRGRPAATTRRGGVLAPVSIVLTSTGATWAVSAQRGARSLVKKAPVPPGVVSAVAGLLGQPALEDAVAGINDSARADAEARADVLRAELAEIQAVLDGHRLP